MKRPTKKAKAITSPSKPASQRSAPKAASTPKRKLASDPHYQAQRRLRLNPDCPSRIAIKVRRYLSEKQQQEVEAMIDKMLGQAPRKD